MSQTTAFSDAMAEHYHLIFQDWEDGMRTLEKAPAEHYGAVLCMDNALPHLDSDADIDMALRAMDARLRSGRGWL